MEAVNINLPGYRINEYLLVLNPNEELGRKIEGIKQEFAQKFKSPLSVRLRPHITLVNFLAWEMMEEKIVQRLQAISLGIAPFKVELKDYGSFPSHTIFVNVTSRLPIQRLVSSLKEAQRLMKLNAENKPHFIDEPHITICRKLKPWQYEQGWLEFSHRQFTGRFMADNMLLLRRPEGEKGRFIVARRFNFMNLPVITRQGSLFA